MAQKIRKVPLVFELYRSDLIGAVILAIKNPRDSKPLKCRADDILYGYIYDQGYERIAGDLEVEAKNKGYWTGASDLEIEATFKRAEELVDKWWPEYPEEYPEEGELI